MTTSLPATGRTHRHEYADKELSFPSRFVSGSLDAAPAVAATLPRPHGDLSTASAQSIAEVVRDIGEMSANTLSKRVQVTRTMLDYLSSFREPPGKNAGTPARSRPAASTPATSARSSASAGI
ncbi:hypothetical protein [Streptomyces sp. NPDC059080]|uniref:hypothetical protein n=1 Tax=Streptomyces sp. NPDC059080 TaxID=3346718 RepID=UPI003699315D